jgi:hypothetical protein
MGDIRMRKHFFKLPSLVKYPRIIWFIMLSTNLAGGRVAEAQVTCVQAYVSSLKHQTLGIARSDVAGLVSNVAKAIGLSPTGILIVPCDGVLKVQSTYYDRPEIPKSDYILYDPTWVREVIGNNHEQATVIFGHELGHLLDRDFTSNAGLTRIQKETNADHFAGCAAGALGVRWESVQNILSRIRGDTDTDYPSREHSLAAAQAGFNDCLRGTSSVPTSGCFPYTPLTDAPDKNRQSRECFEDRLVYVKWVDESGYSAVDRETGRWPNDKANRSLSLVRDDTDGTGLWVEQNLLRFLEGKAYWQLPGEAGLTEIVRNSDKIVPGVRGTLLRRQDPDNCDARTGKKMLLETFLPSDLADRISSGKGWPLSYRWVSFDCSIRIPLGLAQNAPPFSIHVGPVVKAIFEHGAR